MRNIAKKQAVNRMKWKVWNYTSIRTVTPILLVILKINWFCCALSGHYQANEISVAGTASDVHTLTRPEDAETWDPDLAGRYITNEYKQGDKTYAQVLVRNFDGRDFRYENDTGFSMDNGTDTYVYYEGCIDLSAFDLKAGQQLSWMLCARRLSWSVGN